MKNVLFASLLAFSFSAVQAEVKQALGVDQRVDYKALEALGPWDDRNYKVTLEDLSILPEDDQYLSHVPVFFKIEKRKMQPNMGKFYPRSTLQYFQMLHGGLIVDGIWYKEGLGVGYHPTPKDGKHKKIDGIDIKGVVVDPNTENPLELNVNGNEVSIECNPTNRFNCVAGSNSDTGQKMYYSSDAGETWTFSQVNEDNSCCDPTIAWSADGSVVYQADLGGLLGTGTRWTRSLDQGITWAPMQTITPTNTDKEFLHVDRSPTSPFIDNVYITFHVGNVMQFSRSTDMGLTMSAPIAFTGEQTGIGSDITTDSAGNIYYVYPTTNGQGSGGGQGIRLLKSTDGGLTFEPGVAITSINGRFDFPIPSMESRRAFIYVSVDVDSQDNIYVAFTDEADDSVGGGGGGDPLLRRSVVKVAKSSDGGATWALTTTPHADDGQLASGNPIDRFHPWLKIGENDAVHIGYYDTRNSVNRTGVDFYYNVSLDGGTSWLSEGEQRYSTETSVNITNGQEWGDYNGLSVVLDKIVMTWTDNRPSIGQTAIAGSGDNLFASPTFTLVADPSELAVCAGDTVVASTINIESIQGYLEDVTLNFSGVTPFFTNANFSVNPVIPGGSSVLTFDAVSTGVVTGQYALTIFGEGIGPGGVGTINKQITLPVAYSEGIPAASILTAPVDMSNEVILKPVFMWDVAVNANTYLLEVATDVAFVNVIISETLDTNSYPVLEDLPSSTTLYWRVTSQSACGSVVSAISRFDTQVLLGDCAIGENQFDVINYDFEVNDVVFSSSFEETPPPPPIPGNGSQGWVTEAIQGLESWTLQSALVNSGTQAFNSPDLDSLSDNVLTSPIISIPTGSGPYTLRFWNQQSMESDTATSCWDGGFIEISQNGGAFVHVANDKMINDPYTGPLTDPPLEGTDAWCGDPQAGQVNSVDINDFAGSDIQVRFRIASDFSVGRPEGWTIDDVKVTGCEVSSRVTDE